ncbi:MAG: aspartate kinase [Alistipes sp.]|jgi:aspartate kinase|nr:aspartate kinase [Alistipes sp.]
MKVYKFGGASVRSAEGVRNLRHIVEDERGGLFVIVSAMGKTTNALETVVDHFMAGRREEALAAFEVSVAYHNGIVEELFGGADVPASVSSSAPVSVPASVTALYDEARAVLASPTPAGSDFERWYDRIVSYGELLSTTIVSEYLNASGVANRWVDMRECFATDDRFKYASVDMEATEIRLKAIVLSEALRGEGSASDTGGAGDAGGVNVFVGQGFIGASPAGETTTLGREGSDYSAAVVASALDAESVSIWKDVPGVLNADPKIFPESTFIPELTYLDAIELAFSGAQIIHPKTIKPLQNKNIPLYVRPFGDKHAVGSVIREKIAAPVEVPILILKREQVLMTIRPRDYSFVLEEKMGDIFAVFERFGIKANLVQTSAVSMSVSIDRTRHLDELAGALEAGGFAVRYNEDMELLTVRGYTPECLQRYGRGPEVYLAQRTRRILRIVRPRTV